MELVTIEQPQADLILKTAAATVLFPLSSEDSTLIQAMKKKLYSLGGVGLAAPQVNVKKRIAVIHISEESASVREEDKSYPMHVLINPTYKAVEDTNVIHDYEGCFSVASLSGKVPRYHTISFQYQDESGHEKTEIASGFYARVLQHEIDHLNGLLIIDRLTPDCIQGHPRDMMERRRSELSPEKRERFDQLVKLQQQGQGES